MKTNCNIRNYGIILKMIVLFKSDGCRISGFKTLY